MNLPGQMALVMWLVVSCHGTTVMAADAQAIGAECAQQFPAGPAEKIQNCFMSKLRSSGQAARPASNMGGLSPAKPPRKSLASSQGSAAAQTSSVKADDIDPTKGCPFLVETGYGLSHPEGTRLCMGARSLSCDKTGKNDDGKFEFAWYTVSEKSCISGFRKASTVESNATVSARALKIMNEPGE